MNLENRLTSFIELGKKLAALHDREIHKLASGAAMQNPWFTKAGVEQALSGLAHMLEEKKLRKWVAGYPAEKDAVPKIVGIVMAGNIPLVGFHDLLCVLITGNFAAVKPSTDDFYLTKVILDWITELEPRFKKNIEIREKINKSDALIATGSDNTARYFEYYFRTIPHIIRKNRTSIAVLQGDETQADLENLGSDIFSYFGLGCRNVSKLFTPTGMDIRTVFPAFEKFRGVIHHHKYRNNYDYYKSIMLVNRTPHLDTGFLLVNSGNDLVSPLSVLYHQEYEDTASLNRILAPAKDKIQCRVGKHGIDFGKTQLPELWDYADNVDTMKFLHTL